MNTWMPASGLNAVNTTGAPATARAPSTAMVMNQTTQIGPNQRPIPPVPCRCTRNRPISTAREIGTMNGSSRPPRPWITPRPSTADSTEIAGVSMASPKNRPAPIMPIRSVKRAPRPPARWTRAISDRVPPSPRLSNRISTMTYFAVTMIIRVQNISEITPMMSAASSTPWRCRWAMDSLKA